MEHVGRPRGLVRYDSLQGLAGGRRRFWRPRTLLYAAMLLVGAGAATWAISTVRPAGLSVVRMGGAPYFVDGETLRNQFFVRIVNKRAAAVRFRVHAEGGAAALVQGGFPEEVEVPALGEIVQPLILQLPRSQYRGPFAVVVRLADASGTWQLARPAEFVGPDFSAPAAGTAATPPAP